MTKEIDRTAKVTARVIWLMGWTVATSSFMGHSVTYLNEVWPM